MRYTIRTALAAMVAAAAFAPAANAQDFNRSFNVAAGRTVEVKGVNGDVTVAYTTGSQVRVSAEKTSKKSDVDDVKIEVIEHANGVTICAVYPTPPRAKKPNNCAAGSEHNSNVQNNDVTVDFTVEIPRGVNVLASTVNGGVDVQRMQSDVTASTVNGDVNVSTSGLARASTVNGSINAVMGRSNWTNELKFSTVNGAVVVSFPGELDAEVTASTVNGEIATDWPLTVRGRFGQKNLNGTIGSGGRRLSLHTVNGDIEIRKR